MGNKIHKNEFLKKAHQIWESKYDYSKIDYVDFETEVEILCSVDGHGFFKKKPKLHVNSKKPTGCPICGRQAQINKATKPFKLFLEEANLIHNNKYEYFEESYVNSKIPMKILCKKHSIFKQAPDSHINGKNGCPKCRDELTGINSRLDEDIILKRLNKNAKKNNTQVSFNYDEFIGVNEKLKVICSKHGIQNPRFVNSMLHQTPPCIICSDEMGVIKSKRDKNSILTYLENKFGDKYSIYDFDYTDKKSIIRFNCPVEGHGDFSFQVDTMYNSNGCPVCSYKKSQNKRTQSIIKKNEQLRKVRQKKWLSYVKDRHGNLYDYTLVDYKDAKTPVKIICKNHGIIEQSPDTHKKAGCRLCADEELKGKYSKIYFQKYPDRKFRDAFLYYLKFQYEDEIFFKVGVTTTSIFSRFGTVNKNIISLDIVNVKKTTLYDAWKMEVDIQKKHGDKFRYKPILEGNSLRKYRIGQTECFSNPLSNDLLNKYFK